MVLFFNTFIAASDIFGSVDTTQLYLLKKVSASALVYYVLIHFFEKRSTA